MFSRLLRRRHTTPARWVCVRHWGPFCLERRAPVPARPAWLYPGVQGEGDSTPRPPLVFFDQAARAAETALAEHRARCPRCAGGWCAWGSGLARRVRDARDAAAGAR